MVKPIKKKKELLKQRKTVTFRYNISPNYAIYRIDGAHGGIGAQGDIIANLYSERHAVPEQAEYKVNNDGSLEPTPINEIKDETIMRDIPFGISLSPKSARSLADWLKKMADKFEEITSTK